VKRFEFTYEMSWKAIKRCLDYLGIQCLSPRACFKEAYAQGLLKDEGIWLEMIEQRNLTSHVYDEAEIRGLLDRTVAYRDAYAELLRELEQRFEERG
jgi:nucleotidyltransferase substrate binding protein (TIGR01987 family)